MDTGSKKFNRTSITKAVAVLICIICAVTMTVSVCSYLKTGKELGLTRYNCIDVFENRIFGNEKNIWDYSSFVSEYTTLSGLLAKSIKNYGDGSEKTFKEMKMAEEKEYSLSVERIRENFIKAAATQEGYFLAAVLSGDIEIVGRFSFNTDTGDSYSTFSIWGLEDYIDYESVANDSFYYDEGVVPEDIKRTFKGSKYDAVFYNNEKLVVLRDGTVCAEYLPGYYAFKVNDGTLGENILRQKKFENFYSDYTSFYASYLEIQNRIKTDYETARYFIRDYSGNVYTNIDALGKKSTDREIEDIFENYGTYTVTTEKGAYLNDGRLYSDTFYDYFVYNNSAYEMPYEAVPTVYETTTMPDEWATTMHDNGEVTSVSVVMTSPVVPTTSADSTYSETYKKTASFVCYIGIDKSMESESCRFADIEYRINRSQTIIEDCFYICGGFGLLFLICLIYLLVKAGRKYKCDEICLIKGDGMFTEIRFLLDGGIIIGALFLMYHTLLLFFNSAQTELMYALIGILTAAAAGAFLDFALYTARNIRNGSFIRNISVIWLVRKVLRCGKKGYTVFRKYKAILKEKFLYTKELEKTVFIRTLIVIAINIVIGGLSLIWVADGEPGSILVIAALFLFDLYILYRGIKFTGGVNKLFSVVKEMREGNLDIEINKNALPEYLMVPAENLQCLNEGLKDAVGEAIKQERTKTELITNVSHDLKTPLTSIINYVDLLKKCDIKDETAVSYLNVLSDKSDRLKTLIEDLVEASKASAGAISVNFISVSLKELISQIVGEFEESFEEKKLQLVLDIPEKDVVVRADSKLIYRVFENLFGNIRKYALENTRVYITLTESGGRGAINLKNISAAPLNISADELKERFVRGEQSRTTEGNGLGLSIAENFCVLQKGSLRIEINGDLFSVTVEMEKA